MSPTTLAGDLILCLSVSVSLFLPISFPLLHTGTPSLLAKGTLSQSLLYAFPSPACLALEHDREQGGQGPSSLELLVTGIQTIPRQRSLGWDGGRKPGGRGSPEEAPAHGEGVRVGFLQETGSELRPWGGEGDKEGGGSPRGGPSLDKGLEAREHVRQGRRGLGGPVTRGGEGSLGWS